MDPPDEVTTLSEKPPSFGTSGSLFYPVPRGNNSRTDTPDCERTPVGITCTRGGGGHSPPLSIWAHKALQWQTRQLFLVTPENDLTALWQSLTVIRHTSLTHTQEPDGWRGACVNYKSINMDCYGHRGLSGCPAGGVNRTIFVRFRRINKVQKDLNSTAEGILLEEMPSLVQTF